MRVLKTTNFSRWPTIGRTHRSSTQISHCWDFWRCRYRISVNISLYSFNEL